MASRASVLVALCAVVLAPEITSAHFLLRSPASWREQDAYGNPQKLGPCGDEGSAAATGIVTAYAPGETITITLDETIFHGGHYRVALAVHDRNELPEPPPVTAGTTDCGSAPIMDPPVFPVLADGALVHTRPFSGTQSIQVTLPSDVRCERCTLQVLEFMTDHGAPCFYHHCADISIREPPAPCAADAECNDANACTSDACDTEAGTCTNVDGTAACDDGDACTVDACDAAAGCGSHAMSLADVGPGFLGTLEAVVCAGTRAPRIKALFRQAGSLVVRAAERQARAQRFLGRAMRHLRAAERKAGKLERARVPAECRGAIVEVLGAARVRVECLAGSGG